MDLIILVLVAVVIGFIVWLLTTKIPMPPGWAQTIQIGTLVVLVIYVLTRLIDIPNVLSR